MKLLTVDDYEVIQPYLKMADYEGYNSNFNTMIMWNHEYHILYEVHEHFVVMLHNYKGTLFWSMPFTTPDYYKEAIDYMLSYSLEHHFDFTIECATEEFVEELQKFQKYDFLYERTDFNDDYIYDRHALEHLTGKKMQKRRNHYNAFVKQYPNYEFRNLDGVKDFDIILKCLMKWEGNQGYLSESITSEIYGIMTLLSYQKKLDYKVSGIFIDNVLEAFIIGSRLNRSTIQIHVEKADKNIRGLYPAILKEFLSHHYPDDMYINREEDMGLENLRKAKKALNPVKMIYKYHVHIKDLSIQEAKPEDEKQIKKLWFDSFEDETKESTDFFFKNYYKNNKTYLLKNKNEIISAVQINKMLCSYDKQSRDCYYILGVCTKKSYQGQGFMKKLLTHVMNLYKDERLILSAYNPDIYKNFGFHRSHYLKKSKVNHINLQYYDKLNVNSDLNMMYDYYSSYCLHFDGYKLRNLNDFILIKDRCHVFGDEIAVIPGCGYMIYHEYENYIDVNELIYLNTTHIDKMLSYFKPMGKDVYVLTDLNVNISDEEENVLSMMSNHLNEDHYDHHYFINEIY